MAAGRWVCLCERQERLEAAHPAQRKQRPWEWEARAGCHGDAPGGHAGFFWNGASLPRCPRAMIESWVWDYLALYHLWQQGTLPFGGGVLDQPARLWDAMRVIDSTVMQVRADTQDRLASANESDDGFRAESPVTPSIRRRRGRR